MNRILIIRGGAIGDFILTLPALKALREGYPDARMEVLGYKHIAAVAENRFYADAVRSIEYAALSGFFAKEGQLDRELCRYFGSFDLVVSYLFDPDEIFEANLRRSGVARIIRGPATIRDDSHAVRQLAEPAEQLGIKVNDWVPRVFPSAEDVRFAREFLLGLEPPVVALHAGSGSSRKNWPLENWISLGDHLLGQTGGSKPSLLVVSGEADKTQFTVLRHHWRDESVRFATNLPLPHLAAVLSECSFVGHDSGISHLAAAAGAKCVILFGPTDPSVWAPRGDKARIIRAPESDLKQLSVESVLHALCQLPPDYRLSP